jgi:hypothetical protein
MIQYIKDLLQPSPEKLQAQHLAHLKYARVRIELELDRATHDLAYANAAIERLEAQVNA